MQPTVLLRYMTVFLAEAREPANVREIGAALGREDDSFRRQVRAAVDALETKGLVQVSRKAVLGFTRSENGPPWTPFAGSLVELTDEGRQHVGRAG